AVPQIRRRRPTPAMLFQLSEHSSPEDENLPYQVSGRRDPRHSPAPHPMSPGGVIGARSLSAPSRHGHTAPGTGTRDGDVEPSQAVEFGRGANFSA
ncbi:PPR1B phosphatase, partial [Oxylabes madagascariensis]|nr:PPR1B phosphatase [Oxylabes madagascariensis]